MRKEISIKNNIDELQKVASFVDEISNELQVSPEMQMNLGLVLDEMVSNVIFYAYPPESEATIELTAESDGQSLTFIISDQGKEFDPTQVPDADVDTDPAERPLGGMGIFIVKNIMNQVSYQRLEGRNLLKMSKLINEH
jgi:serine/threonine-protein kinase RsbW